MKKTKILLVLALILSLCIGASAASLTDISSHWAKDTIESMVEIGIIKGYDDGTFKPEQSVTKTEGLILLSRVCGFTDESSAQFADIAYDTYSDVLSDYSTKYAKEISYLLYTGALSSSVLDSYIADDVANQPLKRYEVATLLAGALGGDDGDSSYLIRFADSADIPADAKGSVSYVCENGIMNGMTADMFGPLESVTRAQIATLLYRIIPVLNYSYETGIMSSYDSGIFKMKDSEGSTSSYTLSSSVKTVIDGKVASIDEIPAGSIVRLTHSGTDIVFVDAIAPNIEGTAFGIFSGSSKLTDATVVTLKDPITNEKTQYPLATVYSVEKNGSPSNLASLTANDYVTLTLSNDKAIVVSVTPKNETVSGKVSAISLAPEFTITLNDEDVYSTYGSVYVKRNGKVASLSDILIGDKVTFTLEYGYVSEIVASSSSTNVSGYIQELVISATPSIVIKSNGEETRYSLLSDVKLLKNDVEAEVYDIRVGDYATVTVESDTVTKISLSSSSTTGGSFSGTVKYVNTSYGYITLEESEMFVFTEKAKIQNSAGNAVTLKSITPGKEVTVFGAESAGSYVASLIIVK